MIKNNFQVCSGLLLIAILFLINPDLKAQQVPVKFSVNMSYLVNQGKFTPGTNQVYLKGSFNNWGDQNPMTREGNTTVYSVTLQFNKNTFCEYKYFITTAGAENGGWENGMVFSDYGNRRLVAFENAVTLPVVFFNNADIALNLATTHFNFYCTAQDLNCLNEFSTKVEGSYTRIITALETNVTTKIDIWFFRDIASYHCATGYPESSEWGSGAAYGKALILMASPNNAGPAGYNGQLEVIVHEFAHCVVAWKTLTGVTNWLNEGIATYMVSQARDRTGIQSEYRRLGYLPTLTNLENSFVEMGGYGFSFTIAEFIVTTKGMNKLATFAESMSYPGLGYTSRETFQTAWHKYLNDNYINNPPPEISIGIIRRYANSWFISYAPHTAVDSDNNTLTYYITITANGYNKTYTDTNHSGTFTIPKSDFAPNTTYTVTGKSYDGMVYTTGAATKTFNTTNTPPSAFSFMTPANAQTISYNPDHQLIIAWTPALTVDNEGDPLTDRITIEGNGLNLATDVPGQTGYLLVDSTNLKPGKTYTIQGERSDGTDAVQAAPITFKTPGTDGIDNYANGFNLHGIFPNPAQESVWIDFTTVSVGDVSIKLYQLNGEEVCLLQSGGLSAGRHHTLLNIGGVSAGSYILILRCGSQARFLPLIKL
jgi:hypothetical protein